MAKLKAPLLSLGASGKIGNAIVFFPWKGVNAAREYVVPANPKTTPQQTQRGYVTDAVAAVHAAQAAAVMPLIQIDIVAYGQLALIEPTPRTWFNQAVKQFVKQRVDGKYGCIYKGATVTPGNGQIFIQVDPDEDDESLNAVTAGNWHYGTSPTALINTHVATFIGGVPQDTIAGLVNGTKYYIQFRSTAHDDFDGTRSGIYHGTPSA